MVQANVVAAAEMARPALLAHALKLTRGHHAAAEDLVQDAYVRMVEKPPAYRSRAKTRAWLMLVMRHIWSDRFPPERSPDPEINRERFTVALRGGRGPNELFLAAGAVPLDD